MSRYMNSIPTQWKRLYNKWKEAWLEACIYDNIDPASKFVCFSQGNPWANKAGEAAVKLLQAR